MSREKQIILIFTRLKHPSLKINVFGGLRDFDLKTACFQINSTSILKTTNSKDAKSLR